MEGMERSEMKGQRTRTDGQVRHRAVDTGGYEFRLRINRHMILTA